ncbi:hypothetical protein KZX45_10720 [Georgenia sp. EYE_87]|uniref:hypothetical protein n=1 Tax=Georgenia sp. EYE_87 TaxID=2853448 RepID=UPI0020049180|nr:hypothetical protein [Georgenia sp. EYE_87]MCK6211017.1 hypothetical protein [Georgenia sp. EYE_87]
MELATLLEPGSRVIDVGADGADVAAALAAAGRERYLGLVPPARLDAVRARAGELAGRFVALEPALVARSSADVVILRADLAPYLWTFRDLSHARLVAVERRAGLRAVEARLAELLPRLRGRATPRGRFTCGGRQFDVLELAGARRRRARRYLSPYWGVPGLVERLQERGVRYAALRWFENLPELEPGEDLDLLVADEDLAAVEALLDEEPGTIPVDLYSESGQTGTDYHGMAYYPPALARQLLGRAVLHPSGCRVPAPLDHLHSLAYHAVYHKGPSSGLASRGTSWREPDPEHDYTAVLEDLAGRLGVALEPTLEGVDEYLTTVGWQPPPDTLRRLAATNPWIRPPDLDAAEVPEPSVFLVRERTLDVLTMDDVRRVLGTLGFEIVLERVLDDDARRRCAESMRGGNWSRGPFPRSGGGPAVAVVVLHHGPRRPGPALREQYPWLSNTDVYLAKTRIRDLVAARVVDGERFNPVHSSDNEPEAWEYVELAVPDEAEALRAEVRRRREEYATDAPVVAVLSRGRRAKVEVVEHDGGLAVRKTFARPARAHQERELHGLRELAPHVPVPALLATGPNWLLTSFHPNRLNIGDRPGGRLVPLRAARGMVDVLRRVHARGYDLIDAKPQNFLLDPDGLRLIDLEFLHRYDGEPPEFTHLYGFVGVPEDFDGDLPFVDDLSYDLRWLPYVGLPMEALLHDPAWLQHLRRGAFRLTRTVTGSSEPVRRVGRVGLRAARRGRRTAATAYRAWARSRVPSTVGGTR